MATMITRAKKAGLAQIEAVTVFCPECTEPYEWPTGSTITTSGENIEARAGQTVQCFYCKAKFKLPAIINRIGVCS